MPLVTLFFNYLYWHYTRGAIELFLNLTDLLRFELRYFSFRQMVRTWLSPWRRLGEDYGRGFNLEVYATALVVNTIMRLVGFFIRTIVIGLGLFIFICLLPLFLTVFILWLLLPLIIPTLFILGLYMLIFSAPLGK